LDKDIIGMASLSRSYRVPERHSRWLVWSFANCCRVLGVLAGDTFVSLKPKLTALPTVHIAVW